MDFLTEEYIYQKKPQELTSLLYEVLMENLANSITDIKNKRLIDANKKLQKVNDILYRLGAGINYEAGIIADQLDALYNYLAERVIEGNRKKDVSIIQEALTITEQLASSWNEAMKQKPIQKMSHIRHRSNAYEQHVMVMERDMNTVEEGK